MFTEECAACKKNVSFYQIGYTIYVNADKLEEGEGRL